MIHRRTYRPFSTSPHTSGVRSRLHTSIATEPCRPTACVCAGSFTVVGIPHSSFLIPDWIFTFSAKEKDSETGFSVTSLRSVSSSSLSQCQTSLAWHSLIRRFGSRYYNSDLSIWLSVDPMASKYPHQSNYVYCSNNPIKVIDPNGEDEWEVNETTGVIKHYSNNKPERLYVTSDNGERKDNVTPLDVDRTVMESMTSDGSQTSFRTMDKRDEMNKMFDF